MILPASLELNCLPHKSWTVMEDTVTFLDEENNLMMEVRESNPVIAAPARDSGGHSTTGGGRQPLLSSHYNC